MQESVVGDWPREPQLSGPHLHSLRDLNRRFLELATSTSGAWVRRDGWSNETKLRLAPLSLPQREAAASCPYALFDLRFRDAAHWRNRVSNTDGWRIADEPESDSAIIEFVRVALFYGWHIASMPGHVAQLLLGMHEDTAEALRGVTVDTLPSLAVTESRYLTARWCDSAGYWNALLGAASDGNASVLRRVQLHGFQLAAAARLNLAVRPMHAACSDAAIAGMPNGWSD